MRISDWSSDVCSSDLSLNSGVPGVGVLQETSNAAAGVQVTLPIFTGGRRSAQVRQAQSRSSQAIEQYIEVERGVIAQTRGAYAAWQANERIIAARSEEHTSELQSLMRISYAVFCLKKK